MEKNFAGQGSLGDLLIEQIDQCLGLSKGLDERAASVVRILVD